MLVVPDEGTGVPCVSFGLAAGQTYARRMFPETAPSARRQLDLPMDDNYIAPS
jgi:hypothetical protein